MKGSNSAPALAVSGATMASTHHRGRHDVDTMKGSPDDSYVPRAMWSEAVESPMKLGNRSAEWNPNQFLREEDARLKEKERLRKYLLTEMAKQKGESAGKAGAAEAARKHELMALTAEVERQQKEEAMRKQKLTPSVPMTFGIRHVVGILAYARGDREERPGLLGTKQHLLGDWGSRGDLAWKYAIGAHLGHGLEICVALLCYFLLYQNGAWLEEAREWRADWVARIVLFNLVCEVVLCNFWHWMSYVSEYAQATDSVKYEPTNQYAPTTGKAGMIYSETGNLEREITFSTLGWLQSAAWQCVFTHLWACGYLRCYTDFWAYPVYSIAVFMAVTYWREIHFYIAHRGMHPWWDRRNGLLDGDVGAFLYRHVHSLHHKSYNPGPWSGLCMHPVEHLLYYSCATLPPLFMSVHPMHFLYAKFHADIAPIGGHDGKGSPSAGSDYHWLHHAKFECNYGVPFPINFDKLFGTWVDHETYKQTGVLQAGEWSMAQMHEPEEEQDADPKRRPLLKSDGVGREFTLAEVAKHNKAGDYWIVLYGHVLDVTSFLPSHPGGEKVLRAMAGRDATKTFADIHARSGGFQLVAAWAPNSVVGHVANYDGPTPPEPARPRDYQPLLVLVPCLIASAIAAFA